MNQYKGCPLSDFLKTRRRFRIVSRAACKLVQRNNNLANSPCGLQAYIDGIGKR